MKHDKRLSRLNFIILARIQLKKDLWARLSMLIKNGFSPFGEKPDT